MGKEGRMMSALQYCRCASTREPVKRVSVRLLSNVTNSRKIDKTHIFFLECDVYIRMMRLRTRLDESVL